MTITVLNNKGYLKHCGRRVTWKNGKVIRGRLKQEAFGEEAGRFDDQDPIKTGPDRKVPPGIKAVPYAMDSGILLPADKDGISQPGALVWWFRRPPA